MSAFPPLGPEYDPFLYAIVCEETNGMQLTMASAIARSGADPWQEAARISQMPKDAARCVLARLIPAAPDGEQDSTDRTVDRLFALLPTRKSVAARPTRVPPPVGAIILLLLAALCAVVALAPLFVSKSGNPADAPGGSPTSSDVVR